MNILSYRGPSTPGGVSATLSRVIEQTSRDQNWWFLHGTDLRRKSKSAAGETVCQIPFEVIEGHYRYCNEFLWPILHELPQYALFSETDRQSYLFMNKSIAWNVLYGEKSDTNSPVFVNDYQFALCPQFLNDFSKVETALFWHIPWPKKIDEGVIQYLIEVAAGLLASSKIGFHTERYAFNFLQFVENNMLDYKVSMSNSEIVHQDGKTTKVVAFPLGVDTDFWQSKLREESSSCRDVNLEELSKKTFVLSVDRTDYTKGIIERLNGIEHFFATNPDQIEKITFVQVCQKTRSGLPAFEQYWQDCQRLYESINERWGNNDWQPIVWIDKPVSANVLSWLYRRAKIMLVTPLYDGLNLTAKEYSLCSNDGVLILSARAGAWIELSENVLTLIHLTPENIAEQIRFALKMPENIRKERMNSLKTNVLDNTLSNWWKKFGGNLNNADKVVSLSVKLHHSMRRDLWMAR